MAAVLSLAVRVSVPCLLATSCLLTISQFYTPIQLLALVHLEHKYSFTILILLKFSSEAALFAALPSFPRIISMNSFFVLFLSLQW